MSEKSDTGSNGKNNNSISETVNHGHSNRKDGIKTLQNSKHPSSSSCQDQEKVRSLWRNPNKILLRFFPLAERREWKIENKDECPRELQANLLRWSLPSYNEVYGMAPILGWIGHFIQGTHCLLLQSWSRSRCINEREVEQHLLSPNRTVKDVVTKDEETAETNELDLAQRKLEQPESEEMLPNQLQETWHDAPGMCRDQARTLSGIGTNNLFENCSNVKLKLILLLSVDISNSLSNLNIFIFAIYAITLQ